MLSTGILQRLFSGHERSVKAKKNIAYLFILKGLSICISLMLVPMTLSYLQPMQYGIWLTLTSVIGWISFFDIGLGNGLRNKLAEALAHKDLSLAKTYVSTAYVILSVIMSVILIIFWIVAPFLNWTIILNAPHELASDLKLLTLYVFTMFGIRFVVNLIATILIADQRPSLSQTIDVVGNILALCSTYIIVHTTHGSLVLLGISLSVAALLPPIALSVFLFRSQYKNIAPQLKYFNYNHVRSLFGLGIRFFILQASSIVMFSTSNILISQLFLPSDVVPYNIAFKYFNIAMMGFSVLLTPFWSAYTEAFAVGDVEWIQHSLRKLVMLWGFMVLGIIGMVFCANVFYRFWVGSSVQIHLSLSLIMAFYILEQTWCNIFVNVINGTGKVQLQIFAAVGVGILMIPVSIILASTVYLGITGIVLSPALLLLPWCFVWPVQVKKILTNTARGIWNK